MTCIDIILFTFTKQDLYTCHNVRDKGWLKSIVVWIMADKFLNRCWKRILVFLFFWSVYYNFTLLKEKKLLSLKLYEVNFHPPLEKTIILFIHAHIVSIYCSHSTSNYPSNISERCYIQIRFKERNINWLNVVCLWLLSHLYA